MIEYEIEDDFTSRPDEEAEIRDFYTFYQQNFLADAEIVHASIVRNEQASEGICLATFTVESGIDTSGDEIDIPEANSVEQPIRDTSRNAQNVVVYMSTEERNTYIRTILCKVLSLFVCVVGPFYFASVILAVRGSNCISSSSIVKLNVNDYLYGFGMYGLTLLISILYYIFRGIYDEETCCSFLNTLASYVICCFCPFTVEWLIIGGLILFQNQVDCLKTGDPTTSFALFIWIFSLLLLPLCYCSVRSAVIAVADPPEHSPDIQYLSTSAILENDFNSIFSESLRNRSSSAMNSITLNQPVNYNSSDANDYEGVGRTGLV